MGTRRRWRENGGFVRGEPTHAAVAVVLAAGSAERFGGPKQIALLHDRPLLAHVLDAVSAAGLRRAVVVVGAHAAAVEGVLAARDGVDVLHNPDHHTGQASSVKVGLDHLTADPAVATAVMLLADQPGVAPAAIRAVVAAADRADAARATYTDGPGHPVAFPRSTWPRLLERLRGDAGARQILDELDVVAVPVAGPRPPDVDAPSDLQRLARHGVTGPAAGE